MTNFTSRELSKHERWVIAYEELVASLTDGFDMSIYEYTNDMSYRQRLEDERTEPGVQELWQRVELADSRLKRSCVQQNVVFMALILLNVSGTGDIHPIAQSWNRTLGLSMRSDNRLTIR
ncbi:MAG: hypothetical protein ACYS0I_18235 [Planctomycetota bacterium]|jgi:hypothetical protein